MAYRLTIADAYRWLDANVGKVITTKQFSNGKTWAPEPRLLSRESKSVYTLNGSRVAIGRKDHKVILISECQLNIQWIDPDTGRLISETRYAVKD